MFFNRRNYLREKVKREYGQISHDMELMSYPKEVVDKAREMV